MGFLLIFIEITFYLILSMAVIISIIYLYKVQQSEKEKKLSKDTTNEIIELKNSEIKPLKQEDDQLELRSGLYYQEQGYEVFFNGIVKGYKDDGIDLICKKNSELILVQCKDFYDEKNFKVKHLHIKAFHSDCIKYLEENEINQNQNQIKFEYIVPNSEMLHISALKIFGDKYYNCSYKII